MKSWTCDTINWWQPGEAWNEPGSYLLELAETSCGQLRDSITSTSAWASQSPHPYILQICDMAKQTRFRNSSSWIPLGRSHGSLKQTWPRLHGEASYLQEVQLEMHCPSLSEHVAIVQGTRVTHTGMVGTLFTWRNSLNKRWTSCRSWETWTNLQSHRWQLQPQAWITITSQRQEVRLHNLFVLPAGHSCHRLEKKLEKTPTVIYMCIDKTIKKKNKATQRSSEVAGRKDDVLRKDPTTRTQSFKITSQAVLRHMDQLVGTGQECDFWSVVTR